MNNKNNEEITDYILDFMGERRKLKVKHAGKYKELSNIIRKHV